MKYDYTECEKGQSQYEDLEFKPGNPVPAKYIQSELEIERRNPFIEALPPIRGKDIIKIAYSRTMPGYDYDSTKEMTAYEKLQQSRLLRLIRFPMPFHSILELEFGLMIRTSYQNRGLITSENDYITYQCKGENYSSSSILVGDLRDATSAGITLTGVSGCGKSSAVSLLTSYYPPALIHREPNGNVFTQIPYIVVTAAPGSNFSSIYYGIGVAIDRALGLIKPTYAEAIRKLTRLGAKADYVCTLIERFAIGVIVIDEIQYINYDHGMENCFDSLLTIANRTKVGILSVGTEEARDKMFSNGKLARRLGCQINANLYCTNMPYFDWLVKELLHYQWFDQPLNVTDDIVSAFYDVTKGIVDQLISTYLCVCTKYITSGKKPIVNGDFIREVANKYYPNIQSILSLMDYNEIDGKLREYRDQTDEMVDKLLKDTFLQEQEAKEIVEQHDAYSAHQLQLNNITRIIRGLYDYSQAEIESGFQKVMQRESSAGKSEKEIAREVISLLEKSQNETAKAKSKRQPKNANKLSPAAAQAFIDGSISINMEEIAV